MKKVKTLVALLLVAAMVLGAAACSGAGTKPSASASAAASTPASSAPATSAAAPSASAGKFVLGVFLQLTGSGAIPGNEAKTGLEVAVKYVNENGGFNGSKVELKIYDTQGSPEEAVKCITKLIETDKVDAIVGSVNSAEVLAAGQYANDAKVYMLGLGTAATWMAKDWPYVFRATLNYNRGVPLTIDMVQAVGYKSIAILNGQDDASVSVSDNFEKTCKERGITVVGRQGFDAGDTDFSAQINTLLALKPDCLYVATVGDTQGSMAKQIRQAGYSGLIFNKEPFMTMMVNVAGEANSKYICAAYPYVTYTDISKCDIPVMKNFLQLWKAYKGDLPQTDSSYRGWDTIMVMWEASKIAKSNKSEDLRVATNKVKIDGLGGPLDYSKGDREGYSKCNGFIYIDGKNVLWSDWLKNGGYEAYKKATGNAK